MHFTHGKVMRNSTTILTNIKDISKEKSGLSVMRTQYVFCWVETVF